MSFELPPTPSALARLRFRHLQLIARIAATGNLHRAAEEMNITQPGATKMLQDSEEIFGIPVFERHPRGLTPTEIGAFVIDYARQTIGDQARFFRSLANLKRGGYGMLSVGAIMATGPDILPNALAELKRRRPLMTVVLSTTTSDQLLEALEKTELDLVIGRPTEARHRALFDVEPLALEDLWAFCAADHPLAGRAELTLEETEAFPWVLQQPTSPMRQVIDRTFAAAGLPRLDNLVETTSIFATLHLVLRGGMIAILPHTIVQDAVARGELVRLPIRIDNPLEPYGIIRRRGEALTANAEEFVGILRQMCAKPPGRSASPQPHQGSNGETPGTR